MLECREHATKPPLPGPDDVRLRLFGASVLLPAAVPPALPAAVPPGRRLHTLWLERCALDSLDGLMSWTQWGQLRDVRLTDCCRRLGGGSMDAVVEALLRCARQLSRLDFSVTGASAPPVSNRLLSFPTAVFRHPCLASVSVEGGTGVVWEAFDLPALTDPRERNYVDACTPAACQLPVGFDFL